MQKCDVIDDAASRWKRLTARTLSILASSTAIRWSSFMARAPKASTANIAAITDGAIVTTAISVSRKFDYSLGSRRRIGAAGGLANTSCRELTTNKQQHNTMERIAIEICIAAIICAVCVLSFAAGRMSEYHRQTAVRFPRRMK